MKINKVIPISIVVLICISASASATYYYMDNLKQSQINTLTSNHQSELDVLENQITNLSNSVFSFKNEIILP